MFTLACIPAYNEEGSIGNTVKEVSQYVDQVIVCDDGSTDNTSNEAESAGAYVIKNEENLGKGAAMKSLFEFAKASNADIMITIDADGQFLPKEIPKLVKPIIEKNIDVVIGNRFDDKKEMPKYRKFGNEFLDKITKLADDLNIKDTQSGFRAYSKEAIKKIEFSSEGFGADSEILIDASKKQLKFSEEKITVIYNTGGRTSTKNPISHTSEVVISIVEQIALRHPLKYLGIPGIVLIFTSIMFGMNLLTVFNETRYFSIPVTLIVLGSLIIGSMLILMSVLLYSITITSKRNHSR
ncbi:glycosyltransferase family 2 protein [Nitrosopumilus sp. b2]|uniref:glycosyltransferase family 2 protein n=1 Tax=Nitrosopumilus sp. b2 TaxID=2109908 RepID=UPI0015F502EA|nr:glycosyltransferase family 2 protein [Nitrosopumilus sp. b2]KAF6245757.1 glycosyltransferase family 2 protein [Nitrosopumilus sp. b2]